AVGPKRAELELCAPNASTLSRFLAEVRESSVELRPTQIRASLSCWSIHPSNTGARLCRRPAAAAWLGWRIRSPVGSDALRLVLRTQSRSNNLKMRPTQI